jgi:hypothetical protein
MPAEIGFDQGVIRSVKCRNNKLSILAELYPVTDTLDFKIVSTESNEIISAVCQLQHRMIPSTQYCITSVLSLMYNSIRADGNVPLRPIHM